MHYAQKRPGFFCIETECLREIHVLIPGICAIILVAAMAANVTQKGAGMDNILFFLTPKAMCAYVYDD